MPVEGGAVHQFDLVGINDVGQIVGAGVLPGYNNVHGYLLTPEDGLVPALVTAVSPLLGGPAEFANARSSGGEAVETSLPPQPAEDSEKIAASSEQPLALGGVAAPRRFSVKARPPAPWGNCLADCLGEGRHGSSWSLTYILCDCVDLFWRKLTVLSGRVWFDDCSRR
jgi:hypothetical protein